MVINARIGNKVDTASNWESTNPVLLEGERVLVITAAGATREKVGDGTKRYAQQPFVDEPIYDALASKALKTEVLMFEDE